jgi:HlyD family secretion protein
MNKKAKIAIAVVLLGAVGTTVGIAVMKRRQAAIDVRIETVQQRDLVSSVTANGQVRPRVKVDVASDITGKIVALAVAEGDLVTKGQFLVEIDAQQAEAALQRAEAGLSSARAQEAQTRANMLQSERNYNRNLEIRKINPTLVSDEQMEQLKTAAEVSKAVYESSQHSVEQAQASVRDAHTALGKTKLYAPMAGRVTRLNVSLGETAIMGTLNRDAATLLTISDMSVLETRVRVDETDVARIHVGDSATVTIDAFPDTSFVGRVTKISNSSVRMVAPGGDQAVDYEVTVQLTETRAEMRPDFSASAKIITATRTNAIAIPIIALTVRENLPLGGDTAITGPTRATTVSKATPKKDVVGVFVVDTANKVTFRPVTVGIGGDEHFEVRSGVKVGERIVAGSYKAIRDLTDGAIVRDTTTTPTKPTETKKPQGSTP